MIFILDNTTTLKSLLCYNIVKLISSNFESLFISRKNKLCPRIFFKNMKEKVPKIERPQKGGLDRLRHFQKKNNIFHELLYYSGKSVFIGICKFFQIAQ